ncbi:MULTISPECIES: hypothetical protein [unclassified Butyricimonas]|uniref:hypothetical protein n=1 Tax=unclassified Butyricimonas TaxID=2637652 RepID=UPI002083CFF6|nr:hypothetical protein [uncultured Butyricimonas sp.]BDF56206.1 hypothetical protein CE91St21_36410 [Odoribacteraceae bacterium]GKH95071.1 hypothetical protein CE91St23_35670 [Odoribacteraceae bacterium]GKH97694.1 hypothetical protein CE91St22_15720 [Odoribacteraceae bacterium]GKI01511.1 hypothetical protein CE91St24_07860 [Odoribacteraceae bacterium]
MKLLNMISLVCAFLLFQKMVQAQSDEEYSVRIYVNIVYEDMSQVDGALIKVYDKNRNYLCERFSDANELGATVIEDTNIIREYGTYYLEVSKPGYTTEMKQVEVKNEQVRLCPGVILKPEKNQSIVWWVLGMLFLFVGFGLWCRGRKRGGA